jgi:hypothetical protein
MSNDIQANYSTLSNNGEKRPNRGMQRESNSRVDLIRRPIALQ